MILAAIYRSGQRAGPESAGVPQRVLRGVPFGTFRAPEHSSEHSLGHSEPGTQNHSKSTLWGTFQPRSLGTLQVAAGVATHKSLTTNKASRLNKGACGPCSVSKRMYGGADFGTTSLWFALFSFGGTRLKGACLSRLTWNETIMIRANTWHRTGDSHAMFSVCVCHSFCFHPFKELFGNTTPSVMLYFGMYDFCKCGVWGRLPCVSDGFNLWFQFPFF